MEETESRNVPKVTELIRNGVYNLVEWLSNLSDLQHRIRNTFYIKTQHVCTQTHTQLGLKVLQS